MTFREVPALPESARGDNGFGSTGGHARTVAAAGVTAGRERMEEMRSVRSATQRR